MDRTFFEKNGYQIPDFQFDPSAIQQMKEKLSEIGLEDAFGVREIFQRYPTLISTIFTKQFRSYLRDNLPGYHPVRSIYFNKPPQKNWIVNWHQDLTINLENQVEFPGFSKWRKKENRFIARPPLAFLEDMVTIRIHLDDCKAINGALHVIAGSHKNGIHDLSSIREINKNDAHVCELHAGGIMLMKPLLLHASFRSENDINRRVIHVEFSRLNLPEGLNWFEKLELN